MAISHQEIY